MNTPYIHIEGPLPSYSFIGENIETHVGFHAFFVSIVPFIPSFLSDDFTRMLVGETSRIRLIINRQIRFLNDLCSSGVAGNATFDLRFVSEPQPDQPYSRITLFFIGTAFAETRDDAYTHAVELCDRFRSYFPFEEPFNYPLATLNQVVKKNGKVGVDQPHLLKLALRPFDNMRNVRITEIRKYEDRDPMLLSEGQSNDGFDGYFPHPFRPTLDISAMGRFLETFARQQHRCVVSVSLRPTRLSIDEHRAIAQMIGHYGRLVAGAQEAGNWLTLYRQERFDDLVRTFDPLINQRNHLFVIKIQILGENRIPSDVVTAMGSEVMNNSTPEPRLWSEKRPDADADYEIALENFRLLDFQPWGNANNSKLWRLSSLVTAYEAVGAFRLPIPAESGHLPGLLVRDEPFVMPSALLTPNQPNPFPDRYVALGKIVHRGVVTETDYYVSLSQLKRHGLVAGSTGSGKTNTCLHILTELWRSEPEIPFLVIYPIDKPDYRLLQADESVREKLLIFTLGDDSTSPFRFNPFAVPDGILVRSHMSLLMRAFSAAFSLWDPLPAVYRTALRRAYIEAGYTDLRIAKGGDQDTSSPTLSRFYEIICETAEEMTRDYGREAKGNIRQGAEIRIRDLLQNAGHVLNVEEPAPWETILSHPTIMEIGRIGSTEDSALIMGFLLMNLTSVLSSRRKRTGNPPQHITLIEEAHRLMAAGGGNGSDFTADPRAKAGEDFANILAEVRGFNEGILIAEQTPTELVSGAIANTYVKVMHWLEEQRSFNLFSDIMNLNTQQRETARTLPTGYAIMRSINGRPVLVKVANYLDQFQEPDDQPRYDVSDQGIRAFMEHQISRFGIAVPPPLPNQLDSLVVNTKGNSWRMKQSEMEFVLTMPMSSCAFCATLHQTGQCKYGNTVRDQLLRYSAANEWRQALYDGISSPSTLDVSRDFIEEALRSILVRSKVTTDESKGIVYCYYAHEIDTLVREGKLNQSQQQSVISLLRSIDLTLT